jgi:YegS/Rv2252/BmrU family lipid kinase
MPDRVLLANARAGTSDDEVVDQVVAVLGADGAVEVTRPTGRAELDAVVATLDGRELVVAGGDGSLHHALAALHRNGVLGRTVVGLVPMGTGNDFARGIGLPLDPVEAARVVVDGAPRPVDLVVDDAGNVVVNAVHLGAGALAGDAATELKPRLGRLAYPIGAIKAGARARGWRVRVVADGVVLTSGRARVLMVGIGNGSSVGGGTPLAPHARVDDAAVDVIVSRAVGPLARIGFAVGLRSGRHDQREDVVTRRARDVTVAGGPIPINADGEIGKPITRRSWRVLPAAWQLRVLTD